MRVLPRDKQIEVIAALCDGLGIRAVSRITGVNRGTVAALALKVGRGCAELHDRMMVGIRTSRLELDELWSYVARSRPGLTRMPLGLLPWAINTPTSPWRLQLGQTICSSCRVPSLVKQ